MTAAPALAAAMPSFAMSAGVIGTYLLFLVMAPPPVTAQVMMTFRMTVALPGCWFVAECRRLIARPGHHLQERTIAFRNEFVKRSIADLVLTPCTSCASGGGRAAGIVLPVLHRGAA